jgi:hypothetical protein
VINHEVRDIILAIIGVASVICSITIPAYFSMKKHNRQISKKLDDMGAVPNGRGKNLLELVEDNNDQIRYVRSRQDWVIENLGGIKEEVAKIKFDQQNHQFIYKHDRKDLEPYERGEEHGQR